MIVHAETDGDWETVVDSPRDGAFFWDLLENGTSVYAGVTIARDNEPHSAALVRALGETARARDTVTDVRARVARGEKIGAPRTRGRRNRVSQPAAE